MNEKPDNTLVLGLMSGTSLDGLDLALCEFTAQGVQHSYKILKAETRNYDDLWKTRLSGAKDLKAQDYFELHAEYGKFIANEVIRFLRDSPKPHHIASHGHTIFHQPGKGFSTQLGCGASIAAITGISTVCDFRSLDVALGGQGAPLVPVGDQLLFNKYEACLNIGGIANISFNRQGERVAYDICVANMLLNYLSEKTGKPFDDGGKMAKSGKLDESLLQRFESLSFYSQKGARSLGREFFEKEIMPLLQEGSIADQLRTSAEHVALRIAADINENKIQSVLLSGGGALNSFLVERIRNNTNAEIIVPDLQTIQFKEALIFAFLGLLRIQGRINSLASVTGAKEDSVGGAVYPGSDY